ncbi:mercuric reductase [Fibrella aestuarina BUZ 2]|uniref:Mercuric reductase n=1 Tax=Fibrella aestuarina BUZ 2 TaxID=1166018 RepID=I0K604_9BACT|nr:mercuric reductase [Fibrella aestuarina]CCG99557.1 mercuric reductase [Fibrella aestuarina BUZ 2]
MAAHTPRRYDAIIIGVGQAGKPLAMALAKAGRSVAVIERKWVGGTCINYGCTPTKTLLASAQAAYEARRLSEYGVRAGKVAVDFAAVIARKNAMVDQFRGGIEASFAKTKHLTLVYGEAYFADTKTVVVHDKNGKEQRLTADQIFINCGTRPATPPIPGLDTVDWLTSTTLMDVPELPRHLVIIGGGYIGVEFSQMFRRFGSKVTILVRDGHLLPHEDPDISEALAQILTYEGINIRYNTAVTQVRQPGATTIKLTLTTDEQRHTLTGSHLLVAVGTTPNSDTLNLEAAGVKTDEKGFIQVNDRLETTQPGIYALGDIKGGPAFTHIAYDDYRVVKQNLLDGGKASIANRPVPYTVFTDPQLGRIGLTEQEAKKQGKQVRVASMPMSQVARAIETSHTNGLMKVLVDADTDQLLGAAILGMEGGELMTMLQLAMMGQLPYQRLRDAIFAHPTLAESFNNLFTTLD